MLRRKVGAVRQPGIKVVVHFSKLYVVEFWIAFLMMRPRVARRHQEPPESNRLWAINGAPRPRPWPPRPCWSFEGKSIFLTNRISWPLWNYWKLDGGRFESFRSQSTDRMAPKQIRFLSWSSTQSRSTRSQASSPRSASMALPFHPLPISNNDCNARCLL
jgi:hypothetical protein